MTILSYIKHPYKYKCFQLCFQRNNGNVQSINPGYISDIVLEKLKKDYNAIIAMDQIYFRNEEDVKNAIEWWEAWIVINKLTEAE